jgi:hypothetical protein
MSVYANYLRSPVPWIFGTLPLIDHVSGQRALWENLINQLQQAPPFLPASSKLSHLPTNHVFCHLTDDFKQHIEPSTLVAGAKVFYPSIVRIS